MGRVFPELRANVGFLWENRKLWNEMYLADIEADASKAPADKEADRVSCILDKGLTAHAALPNGGLHEELHRQSAVAALLLCMPSLA